MEYLQHLLMRSLWAVLVVMLAVENGCNGCLEKERIALLQLKDSVNFPNRIDQLPSWEEDDNMDCCQWECVECNSTTHLVIKLELYGARYYQRDDDYWHLNASILLPFESLRSLNLSSNQLRSFVGNEGIGTLSNLHYLEELDLADNYLDNSILPSLNKLSNLKIINLARNELNGSISAKGTGILSNLTNLEELDLSGNNLGNGILPSLNNFSNLKNLNLAGTNLNGSIYVKEFDGLNNLKELDLSNNAIASISALNGTGISSNLTNLEELDLSGNYLLGNGILPSLNNFSNLKKLNLASTNLNGSIYVKEFDGLNNLKELDLSNNAIASISALNGSQEESGILKKLEVLDLSSNEALNNSVWSFLGGLSSIKTLDLSYIGGLHGAVHNKDLRNLNNIETLLMDGVIFDDVLPYIRVMTSIQVLSLAGSESKHISSIEGLCELKKLRELDVTGSGFGETLPWCLANLTSLQLLDLTSNHFTGNIARSPLIHLTSLEYLAISNNEFEVPISFNSFFNHSKLMFIDSLNNMFLEEDFPVRSPSFQLIGLRLSNSDNGHITQSYARFLYHQHDLILVDLSRTGFTGKFPYWLLDNNTRMETLILSYNSFGGPLLLPSRHMRNLFTLDISNNHLEGFLPYKIGSPFPSLEFFNLSTNNFEGNIPSSFGDMTALKTLDLSNNNLSGEIPVHLAKGCRLLKFLRLSNNFLKGPILPHQNNLTRLEVLYSANNTFTEIPPNLSRSNLIFLDVSANKLVGKIPVGFIGNNTSIYFLAMAGNHLEGPIPIEFCQLKDLMLLDLSENNITGAVPSCFGSSRMCNIRLSKNRLDGPFPMAFKNYSTALMELDLSYNQFSGTIPTWIGNLPNLEVLLLQNNNFEGNIPKELCNVSMLALIDLSSNNLFGSIPSCIGEIKFNGVGGIIIGYRFGQLTDSPQTFTLLLHDLRMVLAKSEQKGNLAIEATGQEAKFTTKGISLIYRGIVLRLFSGINLSHNRLTGSIPPEIGNLSHLKVLNLSHNNFTGTIPVTFSNLKSIECLDLSYNLINGKIPSQLTELYSLAVFNLSYNNLSGRMPPTVKQFATFDSSSYVGNPLLCGEPLPMKCNATDQPPSMPRAAVNYTEEDSGFMDMYVFYMSFAGSYVTVVLAIVAILLINPYWRRAWFHLVEVFITSCYYFVVDNLVGRRRGFLWK